MADLVRTEPTTLATELRTNAGVLARWTGVLWVIALVNAILGGSLAAFGIHPHTLSYRIKQMQRRYGVDLDNAQTRLRLAVALLILES